MMLAAMRAVAENLLEAWTPACERIEVAGSVRRRKADPHDLELVAIPRLEVLTAKKDMFEDTQVAMAESNLLDELLGEWKAGGRLRDRPDKNGRGAWGPKFKRALTADGVAVDIFSCGPGLGSQWGVIFAIRTGPADFSHAIVTSRLEGGFMPVGMQVKDGALWINGDGGRALIETPEEEDFFEAINLPCWPPEERSLLRLAEWRSGGSVRGAGVSEQSAMRPTSGGR